ncbi:MAG TPA: ABC transporter permease [Bacteroidales bacterium]|nr:ABC transporter permease [Bacteroidales bacterium]HQI46887.1 ABC transporter permease [Bacteroidales bacterium]
MMKIFYRKKKDDSLGSLSSITWKRLRKNKLAMGFLIFVLIVSLVAIFGYLIVPDSTPYANNQHIEIAAKKPGFTIDLIKIKKNIKEQQQSVFRKMFFGEKNDFDEIPLYSWSFSGSHLLMEAYTGDQPNDGEIKKFHIVDIVYAVPDTTKIIFANGIYTMEDIGGNKIQISESDLKEKIQKSHIVKRKFILGTDRYGRDMLSQLVIGARVSLSVGFIAVFISLVIGILLGSLAGFFRGWVDNLIVWFINVVWSIPSLLLVIAITFALGKGFWQVFIAVGLTMWVDVARIVRGQIFSIREKEYVEAAKALGFSNFRIIFRHILPNVLGPVIVISAANFSSAILLEAGLSFLGIGVQPPMPSWGTMIKEHYAYIILDSAHLAIFPGVAIMLLVLAFMMIGNALRDALDVRSTD